MPRFTMSAELPTSVNSVWNVIGSFSALPDWHPGIARSDLSGGGSKCTLDLAGGGSIVERLENNGDGHICSYAILESPLPVRSYEAAIAVTPNGDGKSCRVEWSGDFQAAEVPDNEAVRVIQGIYQLGLDNLKKVFGV